MTPEQPGKAKLWVLAANDKITPPQGCWQDQEGDPVREHPPGTAVFHSQRGLGLLFKGLSSWVHPGRTERPAGSGSPAPIHLDLLPYTEMTSGPESRVACILGLFVYDTGLV